MARLRCGALILNDEAVRNVPSERPWLARSINSAGILAARLGARVPALDPEWMLWAARRRTGLDDFGDPRFRDPFSILIRDVEADPRLTTIGRLLILRNAFQRLCNRLHLAAWFRREPGLGARPVERPIVITGLPRTGTTLLHRMLSQDPNNRVTRTWEMERPCPPPWPQAARRDPRVKALRREVWLLNWLAPSLQRIHHIDACLPEEDMWLLANEFASIWYLLAMDLPNYGRWLHSADLEPVYRGHRRQLQLLQSRDPRSRWVLKAPMHLLGLAALFEVYPDARIVFTHRDPLAVLPSVASLFHSLRSSLSEGVVATSLGPEMIETFSTWFERGRRAREQAEAAGRGAQFLDIHYDHLVADPIAAVRYIYDSFELDLEPAVEARMRGYLAANRQHKHGRHNYSLEEFSLDAGEIRERFAVEIARLDALRASSA